MLHYKFVATKVYRGKSFRTRNSRRIYSILHSIFSNSRDFIFCASRARPAAIVYVGILNKLYESTERFIGNPTRMIWKYLGLLFVHQHNSFFLEFITQRVNQIKCVRYVYHCVCLRPQRRRTHVFTARLRFLQPML